MTVPQEKQEPRTSATIIRAKVYGLTFLVLLIAAALGYLLDLQLHSKPAMTIIAVVVAYPIAMLIISHYVSRPHGVGTSNDSHDT